MSCVLFHVWVLLMKLDDAIVILCNKELDQHLKLKFSILFLIEKKLFAKKNKKICLKILNQHTKKNVEIRNMSKIPVSDPPWTNA